VRLLVIRGQVAGVVDAVADHCRAFAVESRRSATIWAPLSPGMHVGELTTEVVLARCCFGEASEELTCRQR